MKKRYLLYFSAVLIIILSFVCSGVRAKNRPKKAYITFDDGPTLNTPRIVEILEKYNAKATFFVLEERIVMYPDYIKKILNGKNAVGLHGVSHSEAIYQSESSPLEEMDKANKALEALTGKKSMLVRVPYGSYYRLTQEQYARLKENGYLLWDWNVDPRDSVGKIYPERVLNNLKRGIERCDGVPVILFHDRKSTANMLEEVLRYLTQNGYRLEALNEKQMPINNMEKQ